MLGNVKKWIDKGRVAIDPDLFDELLTELRIASAFLEVIKYVSQVFVYSFLPAQFYLPGKFYPCSDRTYVVVYSE